jgi:hypothetical protein
MLALLVWCTLMAFMASTSEVMAQPPTTIVDVGVFPKPGDPNTLQVRVRPEDTFNGVVSQLTITLRWETASGANLGNINQLIGATPGPGWCPGFVAQLAPSGDGEVDVDGFRYQTYNCFSLSALSSCPFQPGYAWQGGVETIIAEIPIQNNTGCANFNIVNDSYTEANNKNFFVSLGGIQDLNGDIYSPFYPYGNCSTDCLGVPGGPAVPGTSCDDGNPCTINDLYTGTAPNCGCVGTPTNQTFNETQSACDTYTWTVNGITYTSSGQYSVVVGCDTYVLDLTITPSSNNVTTIAACDNYTWAVNGQTYNASGTYTGTTTNCVTEVLSLTITPSSNNVTTIAACDSYTWAVNGQTYNASGTYTGTTTNCVTEVLDLTITPSSNNVTTIAACDNYTWAVNGQTYNASGTYTGTTTNCVTEVLSLTITPSSNNVTTIAACDSYTWSVNGQTYNASGTYTGTTTNCVTEVLDLTITPSSNNVTTIAACDSYTWSVNGQTYNASGTYTGTTTNCVTEVLSLTITPSSNNVTTIAACDSYTWAVNGQTYNASGTYTGTTTNCVTEVLSLTITTSSSNTTTESACGSYTWSVNGTTYTQSGTFTDVNGCATEILILTVSIPGSACNDGDACTEGDVLDSNCNCAGTFQDSDNDGVCDANDVCPGGPEPGSLCDDLDPNTINDIISANCICAGVNVNCTNELDLVFTTDANGDETTWEITLEGGSLPLCSGGPYTSNAVVSAECCLADGCYALRVFDSAGDGMTTGGYVIQTNSGSRIIDNRNNFSDGSESAISGGQGFCLPLSTDKLIYTSCDKLDWLSGQYVVASPNPAVSAEWITGGANSVQDANSGYEFWIFDPNGSYSFRRFRSHNISDGFGPASATRACHMRLNNWAIASQVPSNTLMNVRVRARINGVNGEFGPACRLEINPVLAACPQTKLMDIPGNDFYSCGATRQYGAGNYMHARPVSGANRYQFRFRIPAEGFEAVRTASTYFVQLNWTGPTALQDGKTYDVDVRISKDAGLTWCTSADPWGDVCLLTIDNTPANTGSQNFAAEGMDAELRMFPNPNRGDLLNVSLSAVEEGVNTVSVDIHDLTGKRMSARSIAVTDGHVNTILDLNGELAAGMYLVNITAGETLYTERLVIQP